MPASDPAQTPEGPTRASGDPGSERERGTGSEAPGKGTLVEVRDLVKQFVMGPEIVPVLDGVNLTLDRGQMVAVVGASGAGKSTLLHCLGTLDLPTSGRIVFEGVDITGLSPAELAGFRNRSVGFVFQFHHLLTDFTALENAMMPALIARTPQREARQQAEAMLEAVGMAHRLTHRPGELSGGEKQRVAIARALAMRPKLLLADEPTGNLDTRTSQEVHELLFRLNEEHDLTMLIVTHSMELAAQMPRRVRMADGKILEDGEQAAAVSTAASAPSDQTPPTEPTR